MDVVETRGIEKERYGLLCTVCKSRMGAKIQCDGGLCYLAYHPLCARAAGFKMEHTLLDPANPESGIRSVSFCQRHFPPDQVHIPRDHSSSSSCSCSSSGVRGEIRNRSSEPRAFGKRLAERKKPLA
jgi:hypothetical protein